MQSLASARRLAKAVGPLRAATRLPAPLYHVALETARPIRAANAPQHIIDGACKASNNSGKGHDVTIEDVAFMINASLLSSPVNLREEIAILTLASKTKRPNELSVRQANDVNSRPTRRFP